MRARSYLEFIDALTAAQSVKELYALCAEICGQHGFDHFHYGARFPTSFVKPAYLFVSGYPREWWRCCKDRYHAVADPLIAHDAQRIVPIVWQDLRVKVSPDMHIARHLHQEAREMRLREGITIPVHAKGGEAALLSFSTRAAPPRSTRLIKRALPVLHLLAFYVHEAMRRVAAVQIELAAPAAAVLTRRELEALRWTAEGKTSWEMAHLMGVSERTANWHMDNVRAKLDVTTRQQAVARALALGLLTPGR